MSHEGSIMAWSFRKHTSESFEKEIRKYFRETPEADWTLPGLCIFCDITTRTFQRYANTEEFADICQRVKDIINAKRELMLERGEGYGHGIIFLLKTNGYQDMQQIEVKQDLSVNSRVTLEDYLRDIDDDIEA